MKQALTTTIFLFIIYSFSSCKKDDESPVAPQNMKEVTGSVKDAKGNVYPNVRVKLFNPSNEMETTTSPDGTFEFNLSMDGAYTITVTPPLSTSVSDGSIDVDVQVDVERVVNFVVEPQSLEALIVKGTTDIFGELRNEDGMIPTESDELIYARNVFDSPIGMLTPIKDPSSHHLTLSEWETAQGNVVAYCNGNTANVKIDLQGMIPDGTYTFWLDFLNKKKAPGEFVNIASDVAKIEPLGSGALNVAKASSSGTITASINHSSCILTEEAALVLVVIYHINGNTFGTAHIPDEEDVNHMLVYFQ